MRTHSLAIAALALLAAPALAVDVIELKNGKLYTVEYARVGGDRLYMRLLTSRKDQKIGFAVPLSKVVPEFVYYVWREQLAQNDSEDHLALARWARRNGLFARAWIQYEAAGKLDTAVHSNLPRIEKEMLEEQATWIYEEAERYFRDGEVKLARNRLERLLKGFAKSKEAGRTKALLSILAEREQFLTEQKRQSEIAARARKQRRRIDRYLDLVARADKLVLDTRLNYTTNAKGRLHWAAYAYRKAFFTFEEMLLAVEVHDLRLTLKGLIDSMQRRMTRTFTKLADLRWITGDATGALDAVHEILAIDPANKSAVALRDRILDGARAAPVVVDRGLDRGFVYRRRIHAYATPFVRGFGITPYAATRVVLGFGTRAVVKHSDRLGLCR